MLIRYQSSSVKIMDNIVFIIGAGRSGTTWLQLMLGSHPLIATGQESQLFNNYFSSMVKQWNRELQYPTSNNLRFHGISAYLNEEQFYFLLKQFASDVFDRVFQEKPQATYFLEKSPNNSEHIETIYRCFPKAKFIHLIRDGRDVVASILAAKKGWGKAWHHQSVEDASNEWKTLLQAAQKAKTLTDQYLEIRYENLLNDGIAQMKNVFEFLDISISKAEVDELYQAHRFKKLKQNDYKRDTFINPGQTNASGTKSRPEPENFFRKGIAGDWKTSFSKAQLQELYWTAGDLLTSLGYTDRETASVSIPVNLRLRRIKQSGKRMAAKLINQLK